MSMSGASGASTETVCVETFVNEVLAPAVNYLDRSTFVEDAPIDTEIEYRKRVVVGIGRTVFTGLHAYVWLDDEERAVSIRMWIEVQDDEMTDPLIQAAGFEEGSTGQPILDAIADDELHAWKINSYWFSYPCAEDFTTTSTLELQDSSDDNEVVWSVEDITVATAEFPLLETGELDAELKEEEEDELDERTEQLDRIFSEEDRITICAILSHLGVPSEILKLRI